MLIRCQPLDVPVFGEIYIIANEDVRQKSYGGDVHVISS